MSPLAATAASSTVANTAGVGVVAVCVSLAPVPIPKAVVGGSPAPVARVIGVAVPPAVALRAANGLGAVPSFAGVEVREAAVTGLDGSDVLLAEIRAGSRAKRVLGAVADGRNVGDVLHLLLGELHDAEAAALSLESGQVGGDGGGG